MFKGIIVLNQGVWRFVSCTRVVKHLGSTKNRVVIVQKIIILSYLLVSHLGPDRPWAVIVVGRSFGAPLGGRGGLWPMSHHHWDVCRRFGGPGRSLSIFNGSHGRYNYLIPAGPGRQRRQGGGKALWGRMSSG